MSTPRRSNAHVEQDEGDEDYQNPRFQGNCRETAITIASMVIVCFDMLLRQQSV